MKELTEEDVSAYLKSRSEGTDPNFRPMIGVSFIVDNEKYDPAGFSQEKEDSERNMSAERMRLLSKSYDPVFGWEDDSAMRLCEEGFQNSEEWTANHERGCMFKVVFIDTILMCEAGQGGLRTFDTESARSRITERLAHFRSLGLKVYRMC